MLILAILFNPNFRASDSYKGLKMPVDQGLNDVPQVINIRELMHQYFPPEIYKYIPTTEFSEYETTNGAHLTLPSAEKYTLFFKDKLVN